jgi:hypothetical protein
MIVRFFVTANEADFVNLFLLGVMPAALSAKGCEMREVDMFGMILQF